MCINYASLDIESATASLLSSSCRGIFVCAHVNLGAPDAAAFSKSPGMPSSLGDA